MGVPKCARCNRPDYGGEIKIDDSTGGVKTFSFCGFCLPIMRAKIEGIVNDHIDLEETKPAVHNVFEGVETITGLPAGDHRKDYIN